MQGKEKKVLRARREVILAAGAFQSPQLLMLSGVGDAPRFPSTALRACIICRASAKTCRIIPTSCSASRQTRPISPACRWSGIGAHPQGHRAIPARAARADDLQRRRMRRLPEDAPDLELPDIQLHFCMAMVEDHGRKPRWGTGFSCHVCLLRPKSRGSVWLHSADPLAAPAIDPNFFGDERDVETMVAGFKMTKRLLDAPALRRLQKQDLFTAT